MPCDNCGDTGSRRIFTTADEYVTCECVSGAASHQPAAATSPVKRPGYVDDIKFLLALVPEWAMIVREGLDPTFYGTLSYNGDKKVNERLSEIIERYT